MNWEIGNDIYTIVCIKWITDENLLYSTGTPLNALYDLNEKEIKKEKTKIMASGPITSWQIHGETGETVETVADLISLGSKITADVDCSHEIKRRLLLGRKL